MERFKAALSFHRETCFMATPSHYQYPGAEAEFGLYNFHPQTQIDDLADLLVSKDKQVLLGPAGMAYAANNEQPHRTGITAPLSAL